MNKIVIETDLDRIESVQKDNDDERWTVLLVMFKNALKGMGYNPNVLEAFIQNFFTDDDDIWEMDLAIEYLNGFEKFVAEKKKQQPE